MDYQTQLPQEPQEVLAQQPPLITEYDQPKKKRLLSERQLEALQRGRERRWKKMGIEPPVTEPTKSEQAQYEEEPRYYERDPNIYNSDEYSSHDSSEDEHDRKQRKFYELRKSIPKSIRKRVDKYIRKKMLQMKELQQQQQQQQSVYDPYFGLGPIPPAPYLPSRYQDYSVPQSTPTPKPAVQEQEPGPMFA
jgi:hypothetical protein